MAVLLLLLTWLSLVLPAMSNLPKPVLLNLTSEHFVHLLRWEGGAGTPPGASYRVSVKTVTGKSWLPVAGCQSVVDPLLCDLTEAFSNPSEAYFTQVTAHLESETSSPVQYGEFIPIRDTVLDPPLLSVAPCDRNLCVQLKPPLEHLRHIYEDLKYKLNVSAIKNAVQFSLNSVSLDSHVVRNVAPGRQYCVSVCISDTLEDRYSHHSQPVCVVTPTSIFKPDVLVWSLLSMLLILVVSLLTFLVCAGFICLRKRPLPSTLTSVCHIEEACILAAPCVSSFSPLYNVKSTVPPVREKRSSSTSSSESSDNESTPESTGGGGGGRLYLSKKGTNLPSSSSSSSSSLISAPSVPLTTFSNPSSHSFTPLSPPLPPQTQNAAETAPLAGHKHTLNTHTRSADRTPPSHTACPPAGGGEEVSDSLNVNLLTLTFDRDQEEGEEEEEEEGQEQEKERDREWKRPEFSVNMNPFLLTERVAVERDPCPAGEQEKEEDKVEDDEDEEEEDEEEEEEPSGYIGH